MNIQELRKIGRDKLKDEVEDYIYKVDILLEHILDFSKTELIMNLDKEVSEQICTEFKLDLEELLKGKPIQYITNTQEFMKLNFFVDESVLIPQPDTEILVETALKLAKNIYAKVRKVKIWDLCTGSGAIAISLEKYLNLEKYLENSNIEIYASDISEKALKIAEKNAKIINQDTNIKFVLSDMFKNIHQKDFDIIVSNPPYIETDTITTLSKEVQNEPLIALDGGNDGLEFYRIIASNGYKYLKNNGTILMEIGYNQKEKVTNIFKESGKYKSIECIKDLSNNDRVIIAT